MPMLPDQLAQAPQGNWGGAEMNRAQELLQQYGGGFNAMNQPPPQQQGMGAGAPPPEVQNLSGEALQWLFNAFMQVMGGPPKDPRAQQATIMQERLGVGGAPPPNIIPSFPAVNKPIPLNMAPPFTPGGPSFGQLPQPMMPRTIR